MKKTELVNNLKDAVASGFLTPATKKRANAMLKELAEKAISDIDIKALKSLIATINEELADDGEEDIDLAPVSKGKGTAITSGKKTPAKKEPTVDDFFPADLDVEGAGKYKRVDTLPDDLAPMFDKCIVAVAWTPEQLKKGYGSSCDEAPASFPDNLDLMGVILDGDNKVVCASMYTQSVMELPKDDIVINEQGYIYPEVLKAEIMFYVPAPKRAASTTAKTRTVAKTTAVKTEK